MKRFGLILMMSWLVSASTARAGELDSEFGGRAKSLPPPTSSAKLAPASILATPESELDREAPAQSCCFRRRRFYGYASFGYGYPAFGYASYVSYGPRYGCFGGYRGYGGYGYGGAFW